MLAPKGPLPVSRAAGRGPDQDSQKQCRACMGGTQGPGLAPEAGGLSLLARTQQFPQSLSPCPSRPGHGRG